MAIKSTVFKIDLQISDMDKHSYRNHLLTLARHPSETNERMMIRIIAFALHASDDLQFTRGISTDDEPDIWEKNLVNEIELWVELGQPDEKRIRKACAKSKKVVVYTFNPRSATIWWDQVKNKLTRFSNLSVINLSIAEPETLEEMVERTVQLQCTIEGGHIWLSSDALMVQINQDVWRTFH
ncbi:MAG: YaeQ family protein [Ectothiorhodospiraceae bacterium]|nr:YaeQ family protein [Ectothiorhodospiraceae bacterium]